MIPSPTQYIQGQTSVNSDRLNTFVQTVSTIAQLSNFIGLPNMQIALLGFIAPGDGGQGNFYWAIGSYKNDNVNVIVPIGTTAGAWLRISEIPNPTENVQVISSIAALRALGTASATIGYVQIISYYGDGAEESSSNYYFNPASTASDDGGSVIAPTGVATGRWIINISDSPTPKQYGMHGGYKKLSDASISISAPTILNSPTANFSAVNVGQQIIVNSAVMNMKNAPAIDGTVSASSTSFTSASAAFVATDVGMAIVINGAGVAGATLYTYIAAYVSATHITLLNAASTHVTAATYNYGWPAALVTTIAAVNSASQAILSAPATLPVAPAVFTASIAGTTMTVSAVSSGILGINQSLTSVSGNLFAGAWITALGSGTGGTGTYTINTAQTLNSQQFGTISTFYFGYDDSAAFVALAANATANHLPINFDGDSYGFKAPASAVSTFISIGSGCPINLNGSLIVFGMGNWDTIDGGFNWTLSAPGTQIVGPGRLDGGKQSSGQPGFNLDLVICNASNTGVRNGVQMMNSCASGLVAGGNDTFLLDSSAFDCGDRLYAPQSPTDPQSGRQFGALFSGSNAKITNYSATRSAQCGLQISGSTYPKTIATINNYTSIDSSFAALTLEDYPGTVIFNGVTATMSAGLSTDYNHAYAGLLMDGISRTQGTNLNTEGLYLANDISYTSNTENLLAEFTLDGWAGNITSSELYWNENNTTLPLNFRISRATCYTITAIKTYGGTGSHDSPPTFSAMARYLLDNINVASTAEIEAPGGSQYAQFNISGQSYLGALTVSNDLVTWDLYLDSLVTYATVTPSLSSTAAAILSI